MRMPTPCQGAPKPRSLPLSTDYADCADYSGGPSRFGNLQAENLMGTWRVEGGGLAASAIDRGTREQGNG